MSFGGNLAINTTLPSSHSSEMSQIFKSFDLELHQPNNLFMLPDQLSFWQVLRVRSSPSGAPKLQSPLLFFAVRSLC